MDLSTSGAAAAPPSARWVHSDDLASILARVEAAEAQLAAALTAPSTEGAAYVAHVETQQRQVTAKVTSSLRAGAPCLSPSARPRRTVTNRAGRVYLSNRHGRP